MSLAARIGLSLSPTWLRGSAWRRDDSRVAEMLTLPFAADAARAADRAGVDFLFLPDAGRLDPRVLASAPGFTTLDTFVLAGALAAVTARIGIVPTVQTARAAPASSARAIMSLQWLSAGRAGWNAVTALGAGTAPEIAHADAALFIDEVRQWWASFPAAAFVADRSTGTFADTSLLSPVGGAVLPVPAYPGSLPPLFQAGASASWRESAARTADAVFCATPDLADAALLRADLARRAGAVGRDAPRVLPGVALVLDEDRTRAHRWAEEAGADRGARHWTIAGTPEDAVTGIRAALASEAVDGVIALPSVSTRSLELFCTRVAPRLAEG